MITPQQAIDAINGVYGRHPGYRALHAKGAFYQGSFTATPETARLTRATHLQGQPVPITVRFSNGSGNPRSRDYTDDVRGMAVTFHLPDGSRTDIVAQTAPRFPVRTPEAFIALTRATGPGPGRAWRVPAFLAKHPKTLRALLANVSAIKPPSSYAACPYYPIHAYKWLDSDGGGRYVRYTLLPETREAGISRLKARKRGPDYLQQEMRERLAHGPIRFTLQLQIAAPGDPVDDPAAAWPTDRETVMAGTIEVTGLDTEHERHGDILVFDPVRVTDGIELSDDPILRFRPQAYSVSVERRAATSSSADLDTAS